MCPTTLSAMGHSARPIGERMMVLRPGQHDLLYLPSRRSTGPAYITSGADPQLILFSSAPALSSSVVSIGNGAVVPLLLVARE
jgi:hypothetical protein